MDVCIQIRINEVDWQEYNLLNNIHDYLHHNLNGIKSEIYINIDVDLPFPVKCKKGHEIFFNTLNFD